MANQQSVDIRLNDMPKGIYKHKKTGEKVSRIKLICQICGKEMSLLPSFLKVHKTTKYCSRKCLGIGLRKPESYISLNCYHCSKEFQKRKVHLTKRNYCSKQCFNKSRKGMVISAKTIERIKNSMARPEVKEKLHILNSRKRSPQTEEHKRKVSDKLRGRMPIHKKYWNIHSGYYNINGVEYYFRSRWEANYALYLNYLKKNSQIKDWEYETDVFIFEAIKFGVRSYRPDFKIYNFDSSVEYHEVKGYMDKRSQTKLKRMKKYYPNINLVLIDGQFMKSIYKWRTLLGFF